MSGVADILNERQNAILSLLGKGRTDILTRLHDPAEITQGLNELRQIRKEMDQAVAAGYGWRDLDLGHGFHATKQGERYTLSETARRTVLDRLLQENHKRYAEEVKAGLHDKGAKKGKAKKPKPAAPAQGQLIEPSQADLFA